VSGLESSVLRCRRLVGVVWSKCRRLVCVAHAFQSVAVSAFSSSTGPEQYHGHSLLNGRSLPYTMDEANFRGCQSWSHPTWRSLSGLPTQVIAYPQTT
jgi:hypothetical protein